MNSIDIISKYYEEGTDAYRILVTHSLSVTEKALVIARMHPEMNLDIPFVEEAAMLHDIGIFLCNAPEIGCTGSAEYICHGYLGADLMRREGFPRHALVCERHTGTGITAEMIAERHLPLPSRVLVPVSMEEQLICFADKFFSKTHLDKEKTVEKAERSLAKYGEETVRRFREWCKLFLG